MKRTKSPEQRLQAKRETWVERTSKALSLPADEVERLLRTPRQQSLRLNPLRGDLADTRQQLDQLGWHGEPYAWCADGLTVESGLGAIRDSKLVQDGHVFIQNAASWLPVLALDAQPNEVILDVCAAPGGKTSHIAALTNNTAHIWANDNSRPRLAKLRANLQRLGANVEQYTLFDATALTRKIEDQQFDRILLDAPCSGEGLMNLDNRTDFATWSVAHVKRLQQLQKRILSQVWQLLKPGGFLVYSTCTMAPEEDEAVVDYLIRSQKDVQIVPLGLVLPNRMPTVKEWNGKAFAPELQGCMRLKPSKNIEAFFVAKLKKVGTSD